MIRRKIEEMLGRMIMVGFKEAELSENTPVLGILNKYSLGGVILYNIDLPCYLEAQQKNPALTRTEAARICPRNIISRDQLQALTANLKRSAQGPLFIAVDMEGGLVSRFASDAAAADLAWTLRRLIEPTGS